MSDTAVVHEVYKEGKLCGGSSISAALPLTVIESNVWQRVATMGFDEIRSLYLCHDFPPTLCPSTYPNGTCQDIARAALVRSALNESSRDRFIRCAGVRCSVFTSRKRTTSEYPAS